MTPQAPIVIDERRDAAVAPDAGPAEKPADETIQRASTEGGASPFEHNAPPGEVPRQEDDLRPAVSVALPSKTTVTSKQTRTKKSAQALEQHPVNVEPVVGAPVRVAPSKTFTEEMAELDTEIALLRAQLSTKLAEQNTQLREMLARFDAP